MCAALLLLLHQLATWRGGAAVEVRWLGDGH
eukprot:SAG31_NODE_25651_length_457_cov_0.885475_1_plen_30_part_01